MPGEDARGMKKWTQYDCRNSMGSPVCGALWGEGVQSYGGRGGRHDDWGRGKHCGRTRNYFQEMGLIN